MPVSGWEAAVIGHAERIRYELALADGEAVSEYDELFDACFRALARFNARLSAMPMVSPDSG